MTEYLDVAAWISVNFVYCENATLYLDGIYEKCLQFYEDPNVKPLKPPKVIVSKLLTHIFNIVPFTAFQSKLGVSVPVYRHIAERGDADLMAFTVPDYCSMSISTPTELRIKCPLDLVINGSQQHCVIVFDEQGTRIQIRDKYFYLGYRVHVNQRTIDGLLHLVSKLNLCQGSESHSEFNSAVIVREVFSTISDRTGQERLKSKSCKILMSFLSRCSSCARCSISVRRDRKRVGRHKKDNGKTKKQRITNGTRNSEENGGSEEEDVSGGQGDKSTGLNRQLELCENDHKDMQTMLDSVLTSGALEQMKTLMESQLRNCETCTDASPKKWDPRVISTCLALYCRPPAGQEDRMSYLDIFKHFLQA